MSTAVRGKSRQTQSVPTAHPHGKDHLRLLAEAINDLIPHAANHPLNVPVTVSSTYTMAYHDGMILAKADVAAFTVHLRTAAGCEGRQVVVKKIENSANAVTIDPAGSETIDGATTATLTADNDTLLLKSDGTNWQAIGVVGSSGSTSPGNSLFAEIMADAPTGYWRCNDSGSTIADSSGNGFDMTVVGTPTMQSHYMYPTSNDKFWFFPNATDGASITSALGTSPPLSGDWTVTGIGLMHSDAVSMIFFSIGLFSSELEENNMQVYVARRATTNSALASFTESGAGVDQVINMAPSMALAMLQPMICHWVKDGTANTITFYIGGIKVGVAVNYATETTGGTGAGVQARLGYDGTNNNAVGNICEIAFFNGQKLSDARIWAHARAAGLAAVVKPDRI